MKNGENKIVINFLTLNFQELYNACEKLSLDESFLLLRGRLCFWQNIKSKKARYGIKYYKLNTHNGYVLNIRMYSGKKESDCTLEMKKHRTQNIQDRKTCAKVD